MTILMCPPDHYDTEYEINPWMHIDVPVDRREARRQWGVLRHTLVSSGETVELAEPVAGLPDMVFAANAAVVWRRRAVLSRFRHGERSGEEIHWRAALERLGLEVHALPPGLRFEGAGDALLVGDRLFCGHGFRTDLEAHRAVGHILGVEVASLRLVDPRFYHLDTCFCPLDARTVLFAPAAFDRGSAQLIRALVPHVIEVPTDVALGFACNALPLHGRVISSEAAGELAGPLRTAGYEPVPLAMGEFIKAGGGVRCLSLPLDDGLAPAA